MASERTDLEAVLEKTALLSKPPSRSEFQSLAARTVRKHLKTGELLFSEDEPCHGLHIIARGKLRIFKTSVNGREQVLAMNLAGRIRGRTAGVRRWALPGLRNGVWRIRRSLLSRGRIFGRSAWSTPRSRLRCWQWWARACESWWGIIEELSFTTIRQRLIALLLRLAETEGKQSERGIEFQLPGKPPGVGQPTGNRARINLAEPDAAAGRGIAGRGRTADCIER